MLLSCFALEPFNCIPSWNWINKMHQQKTWRIRAYYALPDRQMLPLYPVKCPKKVRRRLAIATEMHYLSRVILYHASCAKTAIHPLSRRNLVLRPCVYIYPFSGVLILAGHRSSGGPLVIYILTCIVPFGKNKFFPFKVCLGWNTRWC